MKKTVITGISHGLGVRNHKKVVITIISKGLDAKTHEKDCYYCHFKGFGGQQL